MKKYIIILLLIVGCSKNKEKSFTIKQLDSVKKQYFSLIKKRLSITNKDSLFENYNEIEYTRDTYYDMVEDIYHVKSYTHD